MRMTPISQERLASALRALSPRTKSGIVVRVAESGEWERLNEVKRALARGAPADARCFSEFALRIHREMSPFLAGTWIVALYALDASLTSALWLSGGILPFRVWGALVRARLPKLFAPLDSATVKGRIAELVFILSPAVWTVGILADIASRLLPLYFRWR